MSATERICERLEEAGVSFVRSEQIIENTYWGATWRVGDTKFEFRENDERADFIAMNATPEQAIAATLGSGTCEMETDWDYLQNGIPDAPEDTWAYMCSECGWSFRYDRGIKPKYCPECGKAVKR